MVALAVMAFTYADRYMPVLTDWYLEMVLPEVGTAVMPLVDRGLPESTRTTPAPPDEPERTGPNE